MRNEVRAVLDDLTEDRHFIQIQVRNKTFSGMYKGLKLHDKKWYIVLAPVDGSMWNRVPVRKIEEFLRVEDYSLYQ